MNVVSVWLNQAARTLCAYRLGLPESVWSLVTRVEQTDDGRFLVYTADPDRPALTHPQAGPATTARPTIVPQED